MTDRSEPPRDLRRYARATQARLVVGLLGLLFVVGGVLILLVYGPSAAVFGGVCLVAGLAPLILIALALWGLDAIRRRADEP